LVFDFSSLSQLFDFCTSFVIIPCSTRRVRRSSALVIPFDDDDGGVELVSLILYLGKVIENSRHCDCFATLDSLSMLPLMGITTESFFLCLDALRSHRSISAGIF